MSAAGMLVNRRFLIIDDDDLDFKLISRALRNAFGDPLDIIHAIGVQSAHEKIKAHDFDAIFIDHYLGDGTGMSILESETFSTITAPFIMITGTMSDELDIVALAKGADDFLDKDDIRAQVLRRVVPYAIASKKNTRRIDAARQSTEAMTRIHLEERERFLSDADRLAQRIICAMASFEYAEDDEQKRLSVEQVRETVKLLKARITDERRRTRREQPFTQFARSLTGGFDQQTQAESSL